MVIRLCDLHSWQEAFADPLTTNQAMELPLPRLTKLTLDHTDFQKMDRGMDGSLTVMLRAMLQVRKRARSKLAELAVYRAANFSMTDADKVYNLVDRFTWDEDPMQS